MATSTFELPRFKVQKFPIPVILNPSESISKPYGYWLCGDFQIVTANMGSQKDPSVPLLFHLHPHRKLKSLGAPFNYVNLLFTGLQLLPPAD